MFKKRDIAIILVLFFIFAGSVLFGIYSREYFKLGDTKAIINHDSRTIFVSLENDSPTLQNISFNFPFKNNNIYIKRISSGAINIENPEEEKLISGKYYDFKEFISHSKLIIKSGNLNLEYDLWVTTGEVPLITIESNMPIFNEPKTDCQIDVLSVNQSYVKTNLDGEIELVDYETDIPKNSYSLNIKENPVSSDMPSIINFNDIKRFRLESMYYDASLSREQLAYQIFKSLDEDNIAPDTEYVELFVNNRYQGLYMLSQRVDRVLFSLDNYNEKDIINSVIYEASNKRADFTEGTKGFSQIEPDVVKDKQHSEPLENLISFITDSSKENFLEQIENIVDMDNLIDNHILFLLTGCTNKLAVNQYIYRGNNIEDKFKFAPGSYYERSLGINSEGLEIQNYSISYGTIIFNRLYEDASYRQKLKDRWNFLKNERITTENINKLLQSSSSILEEAQKRNALKWIKDEESFYQELDNIKDFIKLRISWLDNYINNPPLIKIGDNYAFINEDNSIIFCSLPEESYTMQKISWEFDDQTKISIEPLSCGKYISFKNNFNQYSSLINKGNNTGEIIINIDGIKDIDGIKPKLRLSGWSLNANTKDDTGVEKILVFDGAEKSSYNFLGEANKLKREDVAEHFSNHNYTYSGFDLLIDTLYLENGLHELYIYAFDKKGNYSVAIAEVEIKNKNNQIFKLENPKSINITNGEDYDFKEFIFHGIMTIDTKYSDKEYELFVTTGNIPVVLIDTDNENIPLYEKINANMKIFYNDPDANNFIDRTVFDYDGKIGIDIRGKSSLGYPKKQYSVETRNDNGDDKNISLLDMPEESDWVLSAPYGDKTLIRNSLAFSLSNQMNLYAPRNVFVEVFLNEISNQVTIYDYKGVYVLTEKIKRDKNRVNMERFTPDDEDFFYGGYLLEMTVSTARINPGELYIKDKKGRLFIIKYPDADKITEKQKQWIIDYLNEFDVILNSSNFNDRNDGYLKYIDIDSFIDFIIINELFKNRDYFEESTFMVIDKNGKLKLGPVWDFDLSSGNTSEDPDAGSNQPERFTYTYRKWCERLFFDPYFVNRYIARWNELREDTLSNENIDKTIDLMILELSEAPKRNFEKWQIMGKVVWPNPPPYSTTHCQEIEKFKNWFYKRTAWIDNNINSLLKFKTNN